MHREKAHRRLTQLSDGSGLSGGGGAPGTVRTVRTGVLSAGTRGAVSPGALGIRNGVGAGVGLGVGGGARGGPTSYGSMGVMEERRRSFFYAEDSLRGYTVPREEEFSYTAQNNHAQRKGPIQTSAISAPILRESSLNW